MSSSYNLPKSILKYAIVDSNNAFSSMDLRCGIFNFFAKLPDSYRLVLNYKKPLKTVWPDCKASSKTLTQRLTKC